MSHIFVNLVRILRSFKWESNSIHIWRLCYGFISKWLFIYNNQSHQPCSLGKLRGSVLQSSYFQCSSNRMSLEHRSAHRQNWNDHILLELFKQIFCVNISLVFYYQPYLCKNIWVKFLKRGLEMLTIVDSRAVITFLS